MAEVAAKAWLVRVSGPMEGTRYQVGDGVIGVGRSPENDIVLSGDDASVVSSRHLEIRREGSFYRLFDLQSTNGTFVNGERVTEATLEPPATIRLGTRGPELAFVVEAEPVPAIDQTLLDARGTLLNPNPAAARPAAPPDLQKHEELLSEAVSRARMSRQAGSYNQTLTIMREALNRALHKSGRRFRFIIAALACALLATSGYAGWQIAKLRREKSVLDQRIEQIDALLQQPGENRQNVEQLAEELQGYESRAESLQRNVLYRFAVPTREDFVRTEIRRLLAEFGSEVYSVPPEFVEQVNRYVRQYQGPDRSHVEHVLGEAKRQLEIIRRVLQDQNLPPDLAFIVLVESAFISGDSSRAGAAGLWQFTPATARQYGLRVDGKVDERLNTRQATRAACRYIRELILDFGAGSSVMLALAAYNVGPGKVKHAIRAVNDPIRQRNFWYLYRIRALPAETRAYVPKVIAAMIIGRNPQRFGLEA
jgi:pSer/pThr/pTyr-binding forkhead associated (FHA) protein